MNKELEQEIKFLLRQCELGIVGEVIIERMAIVIRQLQKMVVEPKIFLYEDGSIDENKLKELGDRFVFITYRQGAKPPQIIE